MFDLGWGEMLLIGVVALIVVGPKDLPVLFRSIGQFVGKARGLAREFSRAMEAAADESGMKEIDKTIRAATRPVQFATDRLREQTGLSKARTTLPPAGTPLGTPSGTPPAPLNPGAPLSALDPAVAAPAPAPAAEAPAAPAPVSATEALRQRRSLERAELHSAAADERRAASEGSA